MARKKPLDEPPGIAEYMLTYGDLVTLLLCFFVLLYSMANVDQSKLEAISASLPGYKASTVSFDGNAEDITNMLSSGITQMSRPSTETEQVVKEEESYYEEAKKELEEMASEFKKYLVENNLDDRVNVDLTEHYMLINLPGDILFDSSSAEIKIEARDLLGIIADAIKEYEGCDVEIDGHADNRPIKTPQFKNNWYLSCARASEVAALFIETKNIDPRHVISSGYGEYRPIASNDTEEGRAKNRRVEIKTISRYYSNVVD